MITSDDPSSEKSTRRKGPLGVPTSQPPAALEPDTAAPANSPAAVSNSESPIDSPPDESNVEAVDPNSERPHSVKVGATTLVVLSTLGVIAFLYFARPFVLPVVLACMLAMTMKPMMRWLSIIRIPAPIGAAAMLAVVLAVLATGIVQLGRPAVAWMDDAPTHVMQLHQKVDKLLTKLPRFGQAADALSQVTADNQSASAKPIPVAVKDNSSTTTFFNWTSVLLEGTAETLILLYLLLASGDLPLQKLVRVMPTWRDKKRAVEISHEIQRGISDYLFSVSMINLVLGALVCGGLKWLGVPNPGMWGLVVALCNFVPYFGPFVGIVVLSVVGVLTFDTIGKGLLPGAWYLLLHLLEANFVTPILLGRRFLLNPVVIFISLIFWTWIWGIPGALLSVPILVSLKVICDRVPSLAALGELVTQ